MTGQSGRRPQRLILVTGTGTEIGKTWVGVGLIGALRARGLTVAARKPAQSFDPEDRAATDAERLAEATGEDPEVVCPPLRSFPAAMAPPMAAAALGLALFTIAELAAELRSGWPVPEVDFLVVEAAGGVASPQADDGDTVALADALAVDRIVLVADAGLGVINLVRLCRNALGPRRVAVHLNHWESSDLQRANRRWLAERDGVETTTTTDDLADVLTET